MDFYHRDTTADNGVSECYRRVGIARGIQDDGVYPFGRCSMHRIDQHSFVVGLLTADIHSPNRATMPKRLVDVRERIATIDLGLSATEEVQVGTV